MTSCEGALVRSLDRGLGGRCNGLRTDESGVMLCESGLAISICSCIIAAISFGDVYVRFN